MKITYSFILPVMNQGDHIERIIKTYRKYLSRLKESFELIAVVNGSTDNSFNICQKLAKTMTNLRVVNLPNRHGYGLAVISGLRMARGSNLAYLNSARLNANDLLTCVCEFKKNNQTIIHGVRIKRDMWMRKITSFIFNKACWLATGVNSSDINGTPKIMSRDNYKKLNLTYKDSMIDLQFLNQVKQQKIPIKEIGLYHNQRHGGKSTSNWKTVFRLFSELINYKQHR